MSNTARTRRRASTGPVILGILGRHLPDGRAAYAAVVVVTCRLANTFAGTYAGGPFPTSMHILPRRTATLVAALLLACPMLARAQAAADTPPQSVLPRDHAKVALIRQLLAQTHSVDQALTSIESGVAAQRVANPRIPAVFWTRFLTQARASRGDLESMMIVIYDRHFSTDDIRQLLAFYRTPIGKKLLASQPAVLQESLLAGKEWGQRIGMAVGQQLAAEGVHIKP